MEIKFSEGELIQPKGGLILTPDLETDYVLGSNDPKNLGEVVQEDGDWTQFLPEVNEIQRLNKPDPVTREVDTFGCTAFSDDEIDETINIKKYGKENEINISDIFVLVGSGTKRGQGNSMKAASEFKRKNGILFENERPFNRDGTMDEAYAPNTQAQKDLAKSRLNIYEFGYLSATGSDAESLISAKKVSPVKVAVEGRYVRNSEGRLINTGSGYNHAVFIFNHILDPITPYNFDGSPNVLEWHVRCSETNQYLRFDGNYKFVAPLVKFFQKKSMKYKIKGNSAVFQLDPVGKKLVPYGSGRVYKTLNSTTNYAGVIEVTNLAELEKVAPLADWIITESPWDKTAFINSLQ